MPELQSLEARKLELEIEQMERPHFTRTNWWVSVVSAIAAVSGIGIQWVVSSRDYQLAEIERAKAELEKAEAERAAGEALVLWEHYKTKVEHARKELESIRQEQEEVSDLINEGLSIIVDDRFEKGIGPIKPVMPDPGVPVEGPDDNLTRLERVLGKIDGKRAQVNERIKSQQQEFDLEQRSNPAAQYIERWAQRRD